MESITAKKVPRNQGAYPEKAAMDELAKRSRLVPRPERRAKKFHTPCRDMLTR